jgi:hypothetical protein
MAKEWQLPLVINWAYNRGQSPTLANLVLRQPIVGLNNPAVWLNWHFEEIAVSSASKTLRDNVGFSVRANSKIGI